MALITRQSSTGNINSARRIVDMVPYIAWLEPDAYPLLSLTRRLQKKVSTNAEFKALEMDVQARSTILTAASVAGDTTLDVAAFNIFIAGDVLENTRTKEKMEVDTTPTASPVTVTRSVGTTAAQAMQIGDEILIIGNAHEEHAALGAIRVQQTDTFTNYRQIFRKPFGASGTLMADELYGGPELTKASKATGIEHAKDIERAMIMGEKAEVTGGTHYKRYTGGVLSFISTYVTDALGTLTEDEFENFLITAFRYGSEKKVLFVSAWVLGVMNSWARGKIQVSPAAKTYGMNLSTYMSGQGSVTLVKHKLLEGDIYKGHAILLDMKDLTYRFARGRDTHIRQNIGTPGDDGRTDEYLTECGLQLTNEKKHAVLTNAVA